LAQDAPQAATATHVASTFGVPLRTDGELNKRKTVETHINGVAAEFRKNGFADPCRDVDGHQHHRLYSQYRGYTNQDPPTKHEKCIPHDILRTISQSACTDSAATNKFNRLLRLAFFWAMRSCEYCLVDKPGSRRTKVLLVKNFIFRRNNITIPHDDPNLCQADTVSIQFEWQKKLIRNDLVTQHDNEDPDFNPTVCAALLIQELRRMRGCTGETPIDTYMDRNGRRKRMTSKCMLAMLRAKLTVIGTERLGFTPAETGLHSIRSSAAMALYLAGQQVFIIMLLGRWSSDAFLRYIRPQVAEFSKGVSRAMIKHGTYFHVTTSNREDPRTETSYPNMDPRAHRGARPPAQAFNVWAVAAASA
jgi:hypothetical protein